MICAASPISASRSSDEPARGEQTQWKCPARPRNGDIAELQSKTLFEFGVELIVRQRNDPLGFTRIFSPDDRTAFSGERQDREGAGRQEMLFSAAVVIALVRDCRDDRRLIVVPAMRGDPRMFADLRPGAVGTSQQTGGDCFAVGKCNINCAARILKAGHRTRAQIDAELFRLCHQRIDQMPVLDHVRERLALFDLAAKREECRAHDVVEF